AAPSAVAPRLPEGQELFEWLTEQHVRAYPENACSQLIIRTSMVEQHRRFRWAVLGTELVPHHQDHVHVVWLAHVRNVTPEDKQPIHVTVGQRQMVNPAKAVGNGLPLGRAEAEASHHLVERCPMLPFRKITELVELRQRHPAALQTPLLSSGRVR